MMNNIINVGYFRVQNDWNYDIYKYNYMNYNNNISQILPSKFWITYCYKDNEDINGEILLSKSNNNNNDNIYDTEVIMDKKDDDAFKFELLSEKSFEISYPNHQITTKFLAPCISWRRLHNTSLDDRDIAPSVLSIDISKNKVPDSNYYLGISGSIDGNIRCWNSETGTLSRVLNGHYGDVNVVQFFPSDQIILSGGSDSTLRLWLLDVQDKNSDKQYEAECITILKDGHTLGITSVHMIDRGRNFLSTSRDGTALIWDTSIQNFNESFHVSSLPVNEGMFLDATVNSNKTPCSNDCNVFVLACEDGNLHGFDRRDNKKCIFSTKLSLPLNCIANLSNNIFIVGDDKGHIYGFDQRNFNQSLFIVQNCESAIQKLCGRNVATDDSIWEFWSSDKRGETHLYQVNNNCREAKIKQNLSGNDLEGVNDIIVHQESQDIFTANSDGYVRKYTNSF